MTKEDVFNIMGKYYGNAYYRSAIRLGIPEEDLLLEKNLLDEINGLGYYFSNTHRLYEIDDIRIVPIILEYAFEYKSKNYTISRIGAINKKSYGEYVPRLLALYRSISDKEIQDQIGQCLYHIKNKKYIQDYLDIVKDPKYKEVCYCIMWLLCRYKVNDAYTRLLELMQENDHEYRWLFLKFAHNINNPDVINYVRSYMESEDKELKSVANKAMKKIQQYQKN